MDPYQPCPCGSGKSFKWCCQPFYGQVDKARVQFGRGQPELALSTMQKLVDDNPGNAAVLGYQAELLYLSKNPAAADEVIQKAFGLNPNLALGHWLRGVMRRDEGEFKGALIEFRKLRELYDPKNKAALAAANASIFEMESRMNRPVAARAALQTAIHCDPAAAELRDAMSKSTSIESRLPECARKEYTFRSAASKNAEAWSKALPSSEQSRLSEARTAFAKLTQEDPSDAAAWFNLGLVHAWMGDHPPAIEALLKYIELEDDLAKAGEAGALIEVLRCAEDMENDSDHVEYCWVFTIVKPDPLTRLFQEWEQKKQLIGMQVDEKNLTLVALIVEKASRFEPAASNPLAKLVAHLHIVGNSLRLIGPIEAPLAQLMQEMIGRIGPALSAPRRLHRRPNFPDIMAEAILYPTEQLGFEQIAEPLRRHAIAFFEETWIRRPSRALGGLTPLEAANSAPYAKRLAGLVKFTEDCYFGALPRAEQKDKIFILIPYEFDWLRRKLGLPAIRPARADVPERRIDDLPAEELANLQAEKLTGPELEQAFHAAVKLDAKEAAARFARELAARPASEPPTDRHAYFSYLIQQAQADGKVEEIQALLDAGERIDAESNQGRRRNAYTLRRAQALAQNGDLGRARQIFHDLASGDENPIPHFGPAAEAMLAAKKGDWALEFAEGGLQKARAQNDRDSEQYFMELAAAARRLTQAPA